MAGGWWSRATSVSRSASVIAAASASRVTTSASARSTSASSPDSGSPSSASLAAPAGGAVQRTDRGLPESPSSLASRTPDSASSRRIDRPSAGVSPAWSKALLSSARDRWPWLRPRWIRSSTRVVLASSSVSATVEVAMAICGMRHLPPPKYARNQYVVQCRPVLGFHQVPLVSPRSPQQGHIVWALISNVFRRRLFPSKQFSLEQDEVVLPAGKHGNGTDHHDPARSSVTRQAL